MATKKTVVKKKPVVAKALKKAAKPVAKAAAKVAKSTPKPIPKPAPKAAPAAAKPALADDDYRKMRKYTVAKLEPFCTPAGTASVRARIGSNKRGDLSAPELLEYLKAIEADKPDWAAKRAPLPNGEKRKRGRPPGSKNKPKDTAPPMVDADHVMEMARNGTLMPPREPNGASAAPTLSAPKLFKTPKVSTAN